jgi:hypothetical protein
MSLSSFARLAGVFVLLFASTTSTHADFPPHAPRGWWFRVCDRKTEAPGVQLEVRVGGNAMESQPMVSWQWHHGQPTEFNIPDSRQDLWYARKIKLHATSLQRGKNVYLAMMFNDRQIKHLDFDKDEWQEQWRADNDTEWDC